MALRHRSDAGVSTRRHSKPTILTIFSILLTLVLAPHRPALATVDDSGSMALDMPIIPAPSECQEPARSPATFNALLSATPVSAPADPVAPTPTIGVIQSASGIVDDATTMAVVRSIREWIACFNGGNPPSANALLTDAYTQALIHAGQLTRDDIVLGTATPVVAPSDQWVQIRVSSRKIAVSGVSYGRRWPERVYSLT